MERLKGFSDAHGLCILLVHYTRKKTAYDKYDKISGTSGLLGAADGAFLLQKEKRTGNAGRQEWNRTVDVALVEGVTEEDILKIKQEKITEKTLQSINIHGWLPDMFRHSIRGAKDFLQEVISKFKLPLKPVAKIELQEWKDMQKLMYELQRQSMEIKRTQQEISSLKKQLSELRGLFKGKERKSLEGRIELLEDLEKRLHKSLEQIVEREVYPNVQAFQKVYNKAEELIIEYNEELRAWKNQTEQKKIR